MASYTSASLPTYGEATDRYLRYVAQQFCFGNAEYNKSDEITKNSRIHPSDKIAVRYVDTHVSRSNPYVTYCHVHQTLHPIRNPGTRNANVTDAYDVECNICLTASNSNSADLYRYFNFNETVNANEIINDKLIEFVHNDFMTTTGGYIARLEANATPTYDVIAQKKHLGVHQQQIYTRNAFTRYAVAILSYATARQNALANEGTRATLSDQDPILLRWYEAVSAADPDRLYTSRCTIHANYDADFVPWRNKARYENCGRCVKPVVRKSKNSKAQLQRELLAAQSPANIRQFAKGSGTITQEEAFAGSAFD
jgi:hypothetical protein